MHPCEGNTSPFGLQSQEALLVGASEDTGRCHGRTGQRDPLHQGDRTARSQGCHLRSRTVPGDLIADRPWACRSPAALPNPASRGVVSRPLVEPALPQGWVRLHVHSPLLVQSWLRSSPLPTDMLKLGRSLCAPSGCWIGSPHHRSRFWGGGRSTRCVAMLPVDYRPSAARGTSVCSSPPFPFPLWQRWSRPGPHRTTAHPDSPPLSVRGGSSFRSTGGLSLAGMDSFTGERALRRTWHRGRG